ncbi:hypothetical protein AVEN_218356-1 [Araneus ventricosus]|uniref:Uncharacterized protein n=1 Tax=Araneus ventricosus TaxID=182803 RepID=A0A4Y2TF68_ARAVE|nr:hypothetical protein AVEN_218356-1 [Araneus ventricosus]
MEMKKSHISKRVLVSWRIQQRSHGCFDHRRDGIYPFGRAGAWNSDGDFTNFATIPMLLFGATGSFSTPGVLRQDRADLFGYPRFVLFVSS